MRPHLSPFYALLLVALTACQSFGIATPQTFNQRLAAGYATVTGVRDTTATLLTANKVSIADAQNVQQQADNARTGLDLARQLHATNPPAADAKLDAVVTGLAALEAYLSNRSN